MWLKNGQVLENNYRNTIEFRNGVCRLTIPQSYPGKIDNKFHILKQSLFKSFYILKMMLELMNV